MKCNNYHQAGSFTFTSLVVLLAIVTTVWILQRQNMIEKLNELQFNLSCTKCAACYIGYEHTSEQCKECGDIQKLCLEKMWKRSRATGNCSDNLQFLGYLDREIANLYYNGAKKFTGDLARSDYHRLSRAKYAFDDPSRIIFHWFPHCWNRDILSTNWTVLSDYEIDYSTYTVATGPAGSCDQDTYIVVPETGLYNIYGKLTFACHLADGEHKSVKMEVALLENLKGKEQTTTLLSDKNENTCLVKGDLITLYQSGLFRLVRGNKIFVKYKAPLNVGLSSNKGSPFKSNFGAYRVGLA